mmetsp:Transcript_54403/g.80728  ORF Transcript_54403/g.80728 Transcript_54403/m.80728 type:complete len:400 (-) Transcript_54403:432-1631(-)|eukprot:CAMPEP_0195538198 /NCGR_PEP_ID=MMETSP0794_2-20130614/49397_1 /TAXON_ID=515487 /ORGANISM="Stephanopyxis turris, Strain CCMP 815" /LENGTH=399 /DNA_ID=CAMNT_0040672161 /DNA_START=411 /DNA_END=1610 /DNA_ORIENTATION=-
MAPPGSIVNISGLNPVDDPEYRYKMPTVFGKIEGRGNGIKTVLPNISDVALSLHRDPAEVNKFFGCELGAQTTYNAETDRAVVNGAHTDTVLQQIIHRYIEGFVICPQCGLPETTYKIKGGVVWHRCAACGAKEMVDMDHKLISFILAQDKKKKKEDQSSDKKKKKDKENDKEKKDKKHKKKDKGDSDDGSDDKKKKKKEKKDKKKKDKKSKSADVNGAADGIADIVVDGPSVDDAGAMELAVEATRVYMADNPNASVKDIVEVVVNQQMASALKSFDKVHIFVRASITLDFFKKKQIETYAPVIESITSGNPIMMRHVIAAIEYVAMSKPKVFPVMLKKLYDEDVLEEDTILEWAAEGRSEYTVDDVDEDTRAVLRSEAEPVVVWLQEADSDDESDDE